MTWHRSSPFFLLVLGLPCGACRTVPVDSSPGLLGGQKFVVEGEDGGSEAAGFSIASLDRSLEQWSELKLRAATSRDQNALAGLEASLERRTRQRRVELLNVLESGPPVQRRVAALALGFTREPSVLGPLLAVLADADEELQQKALLGIGVLALAETPIGMLRGRLLDSKDAWTRNNAAFALLGVARAGNASRELIDAARAGLVDAEPGVRTQCASTLGLAGDREALPSLALLLDDPASLVALAAAASVARIGRECPELKGSAARVLAEPLDDAPAERRTQLLGALRWLSEQNLGEDAKPWLEWANKLP
jgi:HEAT repeat protein